MKDNALYLEVDEDITSAIDKLKHSPEGSVQIVVPKRSNLLQSIINLKLLKKAADQTNKELVLVTSDRIATDLAARVGLAVAPSIGAKPVIADAHVPEALKSNEEIIEADDPEPPPPPAAAKATTSRKPLLKRLPVSDGPPPVAAEAAELAAASEPAETAAQPVVAPSSVAAGAGKKIAKVPNFARLQRRVLWVGLAVVLIGGYLAAMYVFTSAKVVLYAAGTRVSIDTTFAVDPSLKSTDQASSTLGGQLVTVTKDLTGPFLPTGKQDAGTKAGGQMTINNTYDTSSHTLVSGTRLSAPDGNIFVTTADVTVPGATPTLLHGQLSLQPGTAAVPVTANANGDTYNEAPAKYTIVAYSGDMQAKIYGQGAQMSGGTSKQVTVVAQSDVDTEKAALLSKDQDSSTRDLQGKVPSGYTLISSSMTTSSVSNPSPAVGAQGDTANLDLKVTYSVLAVKQSDFSTLINAQEQKQVGDGNSVYDDGLSAAQITANGDKDSSGKQSFHLTTDAYGGTKLDKAAIATKLKGERYGDAVNTASGLPGVTRATVNISPAWASKLPGRTDKISITIQVSAK